MLGENAEAPVDGWEAISEGDIEKSTANRLGLLSCRHGLIEIGDGEAGPTDARPGKSTTVCAELRQQMPT
jgi:hypothetical protein